MTPNAASASSVPAGEASSPPRRSPPQRWREGCRCSPPAAARTAARARAPRRARTRRSCSRPTWPSNVVTPDIPSKNGSAVGFTGKLDLAALKTSVPEEARQGRQGQRHVARSGAPRRRPDNAYYKAMNDAASASTSPGRTRTATPTARSSAPSSPPATSRTWWSSPAGNMGGKIPSAITSKFADLGPYLSGRQGQEVPEPRGDPDRRLAAVHLRRQAARPAACPSPVRHRHRAPATARTSSTRRGTTSRSSADEFMALAKEITDAKAKRVGLRAT